MHPVTPAILVRLRWFPTKNKALRRLNRLVRRHQIRIVGDLPPISWALDIANFGMIRLRPKGCRVMPKKSTLTADRFTAAVVVRVLDARKASRGWPADNGPAFAGGMPDRWADVDRVAPDVG